MRKGIVAFAVGCACVVAVRAEMWRGLEDANHYAGPKITAADLHRKVVMVDEWGVNCGPCRQLLPQMQKYWEAFKSKDFVLLGSHRQGRQDAAVKALVDSNKLTYPIYESAGLADGEPENGGGIPFMYVVNHRGRVVYAGRSDREAIEKAQEAIMAIGMPLSLIGDVPLKKFKSMEKQLVLGKSIKNQIKQLETAVKKSQSKTASPVHKQQGAEAEKILKSIEDAKKEARLEIESLKEDRPAEALKAVRDFTVTFPEEGAEYKGLVIELAARAKEAKSLKKGGK